VAVTVYDYASVTRGNRTWPQESWHTDSVPRITDHQITYPMN
jgi:hypothetical protein